MRMGSVSRRIVVMAVSSVAAWHGLVCPAAAQDPPSTYDLGLECRSALWQAAFDDATAAGLNPGAIVVSFDAGAATRTDEGGIAVLTGIEPYEPTTDVEAFPVRYTCRVDAATGRVVSVSYVAVDVAGEEIARTPMQLVKDARLVNVCRARIADRLDDQARRRGLDRPSSDVEIAPADVTFRPGPGRVDLEGRGRARFGDAYDWQTLIFTCRYDEKRQAATRTTEGLEMPLPELSLPPASLEALDACKLAVEDAVLDDAVRRGYRRLHRVTLELPALATVTPRGGLVDVSGRGQFKLDDRHDQPTRLSFACAYDTSARDVVSATFEVEPGSWTPSGEIATGRTGTLRCESGGRNQGHCEARIKGNVRVIRDYGPVKCEAYRNWMWSATFIRVWDGCRAEFEFDEP